MHARTRTHAHLQCRALKTTITNRAATSRARALTERTHTCSAGRSNNEIRAAATRARALTRTHAHL